MSKKKFKDTKVGAFLTNAGSSIVDVVGDVLPDNGVLGIVKGLLDSIVTGKQTGIYLTH